MSSKNPFLAADNKSSSMASFPDPESIADSNPMNEPATLMNIFPSTAMPSSDTLLNSMNANISQKQALAISASAPALTHPAFASGSPSALRKPPMKDTSPIAGSVLYQVRSQNSTEKDIEKLLSLCSKPPPSSSPNNSKWSDDSTCSIAELYYDYKYQTIVESLLPIDFSLISGDLFKFCKNLYFICLSLVKFGREAEAAACATHPDIQTHIQKLMTHSLIHSGNDKVSESSVTLDKMGKPSSVFVGESTSHGYNDAVSEFSRDSNSDSVHEMPLESESELMMKFVPIELLYLQSLALSWKNRLSDSLDQLTQLAHYLTCRMKSMQSHATSSCSSSSSFPSIHISQLTKHHEYMRAMSFSLTEIEPNGETIDSLKYEQVFQWREKVYLEIIGILCKSGSFKTAFSVLDNLMESRSFNHLPSTDLIFTQAQICIQIGDSFSLTHLMESVRNDVWAKEIEGKCDMMVELLKGIVDVANGQYYTALLVFEEVLSRSNDPSIRLSAVNNLATCSIFCTTPLKGIESFESVFLQDPSFNMTPQCITNYCRLLELCLPPDVVLRKKNMYLELSKLYGIECLHESHFLLV